MRLHPKVLLLACAISGAASGEVCEDKVPYGIYHVKIATPYYNNVYGRSFEPSPQKRNKTGLPASSLQFYNLAQTCPNRDKPGFWADARLDMMDEDSTTSFGKWFNPDDLVGRSQVVTMTRDNVFEKEIFRMPICSDENGKDELYFKLYLWCNDNSTSIVEPMTATVKNQDLPMKKWGPAYNYFVKIQRVLGIDEPRLVWENINSKDLCGNSDAYGERYYATLNRVPSLQFLKHYLDSGHFECE